MVNLEKQQMQYNFAVNGGDIRSSTVGLSVIVIPAVAVGIGLYFMGDRFIPDALQLYVWLFLLLSTIIGGGLWLKKVATGTLARFIVTIDLESVQIKTYDRIAMENLWISDFFPEQLQISEVIIDINGEDFRYPALVYAEEKLDIVEESVPYPDRVILGFDEREEIEKVLQLINQDIAQL